MLEILKKLDICTIQDKEAIFNNLSDHNLESLYVESVDFKKKYPNGFIRINDEYERRLKK